MVRLMWTAEQDTGDEVAVPPRVLGDAHVRGVVEELRREGASAEAGLARVADAGRVLDEQADPPAPLVLS